MRILKYLFILLVLFGAALTVFLLTENSKFIRSTKIYLPYSSQIVKSYLSDLSNWGDFYVFSTNANPLQFEILPNDTGNSMVLHWTQGSFSGDLSPRPTSSSDSLVFFNSTNNADIALKYQLKDSLNGVQITLTEEADLSWKGRIMQYFQTIKSKQDQSLTEQTLAQLKIKLQDEMNLYTVQESSGLFTIPSIGYVYQSVQVNAKDWPKVKRDILTKIVQFVQQNSIEIQGQPFVLYKTSPTAPIVEAEIGIGLAQEMYVQAVSDVVVGQRPAARAQRVQMTGDFNHISEAFKALTKMSYAEGLIGHPNYNWMEEWYLFAGSASKPSALKSAVYRLYAPETIAPGTTDPATTTSENAQQ